MTRFFFLFGPIAAFALLSACSNFGATAPTAASVAAPVAPPAPALPAGAALGGLLGGPVGSSLDDADRQAAYAAQVAALETGQRHAWRGKRSAFGYVEPGADSGGCRAYSQTIYIAGRPQLGHGVGCKQPDGSWRMTS